MREIAGLRRDEEGVSAAVATVLLFGGVLSLIGMMLITMLPVIQELEGSIERNSMLSQMNEYATQTVRLAESGMPGDGVSLEFETLDGELLWDNMRGGSWLSATWTENQSLRIRDAMDLDRDVEFRYPSGEVGSICWDDMRLGPDRFHYTRIANISGKVLVVPKIGIAENLMPVELILSQGSKSVSGIIHGSSIWSAELPLPESSGEAWLQANNQVDVYLLRGEGGATEAPPIDDNPVTGQGKSWMVPLDVGTTELNMVGKDTMRIDWTEGENYGSEIAVAGGGFFSEGASWSRNLSRS